MQQVMIKSFFVAMVFLSSAANAKDSSTLNLSIAEPLQQQVMALIDAQQGLLLKARVTVEEYKTAPTAENFELEQKYAAR